MGQKPQILVDTDIIIKAIRGNKQFQFFLSNNENLSISIITYLELSSGLKTRQRLIDLNKQIQVYTVYYLNETISKIALQLIQKYTVSNHLFPQDALIAATALHFGVSLFTDNKKDFDFIKELSLYNL